MKDIGIHITDPISVMCDNTSVINIFKNLIIHSRMKPISIRYYLLKEKVSKGEVTLEFIPIIEQVADIFINPLPKEILSTYKINLE